MRTTAAIPALALTLAAASALAQVTIFEPYPGDTISAAGDVSADGRLVTGISNSSGTTPLFHPFFWTPTGGRTNMTGLPGITTRTSAAAVSDDGNYVIGTTAPDFQTTSQLYRWSQAGGFQTLGALAGWQSIGVTDANGNGNAIVGRVQNGGGATPPTAAAIRWTPSTGVQSLGYLRPGSNYAEAYGVSRDGNVIVGLSAPSFFGPLEAFRWTPQTGMQAIRPETGSVFTETYAKGVSGNGQVIVGTGHDPVLNQARPFRWTEQTGMVDLGLPLDGLGGIANLVTFDGSMLVVDVMDATSGINIPYLWTSANGYVPWSDYLAQHGVALPAGYMDYHIEGISDDGRTFAGWTRAGSIGGSSRGFIVTIPTPGAACLLSLGLYGLNRRRR